MKKAFSSYLMALVFVAMPGVSLSQGSAGIARLGDQLTLNLPLPISKNTDEAYIPIFPHSPSPYSTLTELTADEVNFPSVFMPIVSEFSNIQPTEYEQPTEYLATTYSYQLDNFFTRVSDNQAFGLENGRAKHWYSKRQAWNRDETILEIGYQLLDANSFQLLGKLNPVSDWNWSNLHPDIIYGLRYAGTRLNEFVRYNVRTDKTLLIRSFPEYDKCYFGGGYGSLSNDDRYVVLSCYLEDGTGELLSFDIKQNEIIAKFTPRQNFTWSGFSQSGEYILIGNYENFQNGVPTSLYRYNKWFGDESFVTANAQHGDFGVDVDGEDVYTMISWDYIYYYRLSDNAHVRIPVSSPENQAGHGHVSCRNIRRPGWCYFSSYGQNMVGAVKLAIDPSVPATTGVEGETLYQGVGVLEQWGFHRSTSSSYDATPKASVSPTGRQVVYTSDWNGLGEINDYVLQVPWMR